MRMGNTVTAGVSLERLSRIDAAMLRYVDGTHIPGIVTLVYRRGELLHHHSIGVLGPDGRRMGRDAIFRLYSMTKPIVCTALLMLYEQGLFQLTDPVSRFIPGFGRLKVHAGAMAGRRGQLGSRSAARASHLVDATREVTIHDLLVHTSGLTYPWLEYGPVEELYRRHISHLSGQPLADLVDELLELPLAFQPGSQFRYGLSHDVAARLIEVISGLPLDRFLQERIFEPLAMVDTGYYVPKSKQERFAALIGARDPANSAQSRTWELAAAGKFDWISNPESDLEYRRHQAFRGGHGLVSTAADYLRFCTMLLNRGALDSAQILGSKTVEFMTTNQLPDSLLPFDINGRVQRGYGYGLGVRVMLDPGQSHRPGSVGEYGWAGAANPYFWIDPAEEFIGIVLAQIMPTGFYPLAEDFRVLAYQAIVD